MYWLMLMFLGNALFEELVEETEGCHGGQQEPMLR